MNTSTAPSVLRPIISRYLEFQRALGKGFHNEQSDDLISTSARFFGG